jgi:cell filamentation protein, protein adenylyltransferase
LVGRANAALARYDGLLEGLVNPQVLLSPLLMKEAELSSRIEGTIATANEAYQREAGQEFEPEKSADIQEILNYRRALRNAGDTIQQRPISLHLIRQMHETLMADVRGEDKNPGRFRETQNWIGPRGCKIEEATYVPPPPVALVDLLENFIAYVNVRQADIDPIVQAALIHAQFEMIHPFDDGNGRIGRILIPLFLTKQKCLVGPSFYISRYLEENRDEYYRSLKQISEHGDWNGWVRFFLEALTTQARTNQNLVRQISQLYDDMKRSVSELLHTDRAIHIVDMLFDRPIFQAPEVHVRLDIQRQRAANYIRALKEAGLVREIRPARGRKAAILSFDELWRITDQQ